MIPARWSIAAVAAVGLLAGCATSRPAPAPQLRPEPPGLNAQVAQQPSAVPTSGLAVFTDGTYLVGQDVQPGTYRTAGAPRPGGMCTWARLADTHGTIIDSGHSAGPMTLTLLPTDAAVETTGCIGWAKVD